MEDSKEAVFDRVWQRVMTTDRASCPITWDAPKEAETTEMAERPLCPVSAGDAPKSDFPKGTGGFLDADSASWGPMLQEMIREELRDSRTYRMMAKRVSGNPSRLFQGMAKEELAHAKSLSAAYFLISGVKYWPEAGVGAPERSYLGFLRRRFHGEQQGMAAYLAAAEGTEDPCLKQMFLDHARQEWGHACLLRGLVEEA